jgi:CheY-like chemotaxis protein
LTVDSDIFVVDDEPVIASTLSEILRQNGFSAKAFTDPFEALTASRCRCPKLVITDLKMPGLSGIELAIQMRQACSACKIILFPGQAIGSDLLQRARDQGCDFLLIQKPVVPLELLLAIRKLIPHGDVLPKAE